MMQKPSPDVDPRRHTDVVRAACAFGLNTEQASVAHLGQGHINATYLISLPAHNNARYVLQEINTTVFTDPCALMSNFCRVADHLIRRTREPGEISSVRYLQTVDGDVLYTAEGRRPWRCYHYIDDVRICETVTSEHEAREAGLAFGVFQRQLSDLPGPPLRETIPGFHDTPSRFEALLKSIKDDPLGRAADAAAEIDFAMARIDKADILLKAQAAGDIPIRTPHNDAKVNNLLLNTKTGKAAYIIDLDTVMPGLTLFDFGDLVRTATASTTEDDPDPSNMCICIPLFAALTDGFIEGTGGILTPRERELLPFSGVLISLEIGIRFLADFLMGDGYFKTCHPRHNLQRTRTQFALVQSIEEHMNELEQIVLATNKRQLRHCGNR